MPNPRIPEHVKARRGTLRSDRTDAAYDADVTEQDNALAEYDQRWTDAYARAMRGENVKSDITFLRKAERALKANGLGERKGSIIVELAADAAEHF